MGLVLRVYWKRFGSEISKDRDIINHLLTRISVSFCIYSMRGLEKERDKGQRVIKKPEKQKE